MSHKREYPTKGKRLGDKVFKEEVRRNQSALLFGYDDDAGGDEAEGEGAGAEEDGSL